MKQQQHGNNILVLSSTVKFTTLARLHHKKKQLIKRGFADVWRIILTAGGSLHGSRA